MSKLSYKKKRNVVTSDFICLELKNKNKDNLLYKNLSVDNIKTIVNDYLNCKKDHISNGDVISDIIADTYITTRRARTVDNSRVLKVVSDISSDLKISLGSKVYDEDFIEKTRQY